MKFLGRLKFRAERVRGYALWVQALMMADIWLSSRGFSWWVALLVGIPTFLIVYYVDRKYIYPSEAETAWRDNPAFQRLMEDKDA